MKRAIAFVLAVLLCVALVGCSAPTQSTVSPSFNNAPKENPVTASQIVATFVKEGLPLSNITVYTSETDPNERLGRPGEYTSKVNWGDARYPESLTGDSDFGTIEVFDNQKDLEARKDYIENIFETTPLLKQYMYEEGLALLRLDYSLTPEQAEEYNAILKNQKFVNAQEAIEIFENTSSATPDDDSENIPDESESTEGSNPYGFGDIPCFEPGQYKVGVDIEAGEYFLVNASQTKAYFSVSADANEDDILFNDNFEANSVVTVREGEYLNLSRCIAMPAEEFYAEYSVKNYVSGSMLKVGHDIQPGEYKVVAENEKGYYCIYNDSRHDEIVANKNFEGSVYVEIKEGQYLLLSGCSIENS